MKSRRTSISTKTENTTRDENISEIGNTLPGDLDYFLRNHVKPGTNLSAGIYKYPSSSNSKQQYSCRAPVDFLYLGNINPTEMTQPNIDALMVILQPANAGRYFPAGKHMMQIQDRHESTHNYYFTTQHPLVVRMDSYDNIVCDVVDPNTKNLLGKGMFSTVQPCLGSVKYRHDQTPGLKFEPDHGKSAMKLGRQNSTGKGPFMDAIFAEYERASICPHLRMRQPLFGMSLEGGVISCLPMRKLNGKELFDILTCDFNSMKCKNAPLLSVDDRFRISIALFKKLKKQIHAKELIHRDIKPENILAYKDTTGWHINIIDLNLAQSREINDGKICGTAEYIAPEVLSGNIVEGSDIYSMSLTISLLWRNKSQLKLLMMDDKKEVIQLRISTLWKTEFTMFTGIDDLPPQCRADIIAALEKSTECDLDKRSHIDECIESFEAAYLSYKKITRTIPPASYADAETGYKSGVDSRLILKKFSDDFVSINSTNELLASLEPVIRALPDNTHAVNEFVAALGLECLVGINEKNKLIETMKINISAFFNAYAKIIKIYEKLAKIHGLMTKLALEGNMNHHKDLSALGIHIFQLETFLGKILKTPVDIDMITTETAHLERKYIKVKCAKNYFSSLLPEDVRADQQNLTTQSINSMTHTID